jgi:small subunit ribosomal protein S20
MKTHVKRFMKAVEAGDVELAQKELPEAMQQLDKAAKRNVIHKNTASRKISRLSKKMSKLKKPEEPASE